MEHMDEEAIKASVKYLRSAVSKIQELAVPATPDNYSIWYDYYSGRNPSLSKMVDTYLNNGGEYTPEFSRQVYARFFLADAERELIEIKSAIRALIDSLIQELTDIDSGMGGYSESLAHASAQLAEQNGIDVLGDLVEKLILETNRQRDSNLRNLEKVNSLKQDISQMRDVLEEMSEAAFEDALTGIPNRRALDETIRLLIENAETKPGPYCLILLDIDHFKMVNDDHGHTVGDRVLRFVAEMIKRSVKGGDFVARFGGEEFSVVLPNTSYQDGFQLAQNILKNISTARFKIRKNGKSLHSITLSAGITELRQGDTLESFIDRADTLLYAAKDAGRNIVKGDGE